VEKLSLGVSVSTIYLFQSDATFQETCVNTANPSSCGTTATPAFPFKVPTISTIPEKRVYPIRVAVGAAYFPTSNLLISTDFTYHTAVDDPVFGNKIATLDAAVGTEYYISKKWAVRAGLFTNLANTPPIVAGVTSIEEHVNIYGGSLSLTRFSGDTSVTLGGSMSYGVGQSQIGGTSSTAAQDATTFGWTMFLSSSY
jgi:long-chain fatty acid transport protein